MLLAVSIGKIYPKVSEPLLISHCQVAVTYACPAHEPTQPACRDHSQGRCRLVSTGVPQELLRTFVCYEVNASSDSIPHYGTSTIVRAGKWASWDTYGGVDGTQNKGPSIPYASLSFVPFEMCQDSDSSSEVHRSSLRRPFYRPSAPISVH
jgi:hypothetical protein